LGTKLGPSESRTLRMPDVLWRGGQAGGAMCAEPHGRSESKYAVSAAARAYGPTHQKTDDAEEA
jgi:hypothetical protein